MPSVIFIALFAHACRMSEALKEADEHIELPGNNGRYANYLQCNQEPI